MNYSRFLLAFFILSVCFCCKKKEATLDPSSYVKIPDVNFEKKLIELGIDDKQDGLLLKSSAERVTKLDISGSESKWGVIQRLDGLDAFVNLKSLRCDFNKIASIDITKNIKIVSLKCGNNELSNLNFKTNNVLDTLDFNGTMDNIDFSNNINLSYLSFGGKMKNIDISKNINLRYLGVIQTPITEIDISKNINLKVLGVIQTPITEIDISKNINLEKLYCQYNQLTSLDISKNISLKTLYCYSNQLSSFDVSKNTVLDELLCFGNKIQTICVSSLNQPKNSWSKDPSTTYKICN